MSDSDTPPSAADQIQGTCLVVGAATVFAVVALVVKVDPLPLLIATECRFLVSWVVAIAFMLKYRKTLFWFGPPKNQKSRGLYWFGPPDLRVWLVLKCAMSFAFITLWWTALRFAPIGDCIAIIYTSPIITSLLSRVMLNERLPCLFPCQVALCCLGTLLVLDPPCISRLYTSDSTPTSTNSDYTFVFLALGAAAVVPIVTRKAKDCSWVEVEHVNAFLASFVLDPALMLGKFIMSGDVPQLPAQSPGEIGLILLAAMGSFIGIAMETKGYQMAEVGKASMFRYVEVPFAYVLQQFGTSEPVKIKAVLGSLLIVGSCFLGLKKDKQDVNEDDEQDNGDTKSDPLLG